MADVVDLPMITRLKGDPDRCLQAAIGQLTDVVIAGYDKDGNEYFASSDPDGGAVIWLLERAKLKLLTTDASEPSDE